MAQFSIMFPACIALFIYNLSTLELTFQHIAFFFGTLNLCYMAYNLRVLCATIAVTLLTITSFYMYDATLMISRYTSITANLALYSPTTTDLIVVANAFLLAVAVLNCCDSIVTPLQQTTRVSRHQSRHNKRPSTETETYSDRIRQVLMMKAYHQHKLVTMNLREELLKVAIGNKM
jgi:hypothetical protein